MTTASLPSRKRLIRPLSIVLLLRVTVHDGHLHTVFTGGSFTAGLNGYGLIALHGGEGEDDCLPLLKFHLGALFDRETQIVHSRLVVLVDFRRLAIHRALDEHLH